MSDSTTVTTTPNQTTAAPAAVTATTPLPNPVIDSGDRLKAMAEKFRANYAPPKSTDTPKDPLLMNKEGAAPAKKEEGKEVSATTPLAEAGKHEAPAQSTEEPKLDPSVNLSPKARDHFKRLEQSRDDYRKQMETFRTQAEEREKVLKEREAELARFKGLPVAPEEIEKALKTSETLTKTNEELVKLVETINLERSPRFQNWWKTETEKHVKVAQRHVPVEKREEFARLLMEEASTERNAKLDEIIEPLDNTSKRLINGAIEQLEGVKLQREEALTRGSEEYKRLVEAERAEKEKVEKATKQRREQLTKSALELARGFDAFKKTDDESHNAKIAEREAFVEACVRGQIDEETMLRLPAVAVQYLHLKESVVPGLQAELEKERALVKQLQGGARIGDGGAGAAKPLEAPAGNRFAARVKELTTVAR